MIKKHIVKATGADWHVYCTIVFFVPFKIHMSYFLLNHSDKLSVSHCTFEMTISSLMEEYQLNIFITSPAGVAAKYCGQYVCVCSCVCLSVHEHISPQPHARSLPNFLCMLPMSVARSSFGMLTGVTGVHSVGEVSL